MSNGKPQCYILGIYFDREKTIYELWDFKLQKVVKVERVGDEVFRCSQCGNGVCPHILYVLRFLVGRWKH